MFTRWTLFRNLSLVTAATATTASVANFLISDSRDEITGTCEFSEHTQKQRECHPVSGMHAPFLTKNDEELQRFNQYHSLFSHLLPKSVEELQKKQALQMPVKIRPLSECPVSLDPSNTLLAVGGPPALMTATAVLETGMPVVYLNNTRAWPIANGSAWHIEEDADAEGPTNFTPLAFMKKQIMRATITRESYSKIEQTALYPWRTLDWVGYAKSPDQWLPGFKVALAFQLNALKNAGEREAVMNKVAAQCISNEKFYLELNQKLSHKLLLPGSGSIIVARTQSELNDLAVQQKNLAREDRAFNILSRDEIIKRFGFELKGIGFAEKPHDRVLSPNYQKLLTSHIKQHGGTVIDGTLTIIYTDNQQQGGVARYRTPDSKEHYLPFGQLAMSLGNQQISDTNGKPLFDIIGATGSSGLAHVYTPIHYKLPRVAVFGGTNHVTVLSTKPVEVTLEGKPYHLNLIRFTAGACITPAKRGAEGGHYDGTISLGLVNSLYKTLDKECIVKPLTVYGCNRMVSKHGQTTWIQPYPGIHIQYGAGGGGLTRAPDLAITLAAREKKSPRPPMG